jgi:hypothetical protein
LHALKKAGVVAIRYHGNRDLVEPLATAIGVRPASFTVATRTAMVNGLQDKFPGKVVLVIGSRDDVSAILRQISADMTTPQLIVPFAIPSKWLQTSSETANLVFATRVQARSTRALLLRFVPWE